MPRARNENLGDGREVREEPRGEREPVQAVLKERTPLQLVVKEEETAVASIIGKGVAFVEGVEDRGVQLLGRAHHDKPKLGVVQRIFEGKVLATERLKGVRKTVLHLLQHVGRRVSGVGEIENGLCVHLR